MLFEHKRAKKMAMEAPVSGDCEEGCKAGENTLVRLLSALSPGMPAVFFFSVFWDEQSKKIMGMPVFFEFFFFLFWVTLFLQGRRR